MGTTANSKPKLKNTLSTSPNIFRDIEKQLVSHGATRVSFTYGTGELQGIRLGISFVVNVNGNNLVFDIPVDVPAVQRILKEQARTYAQSRTYSIQKAQQTTWANIRDWIASEMAMIDMGQGTMQRRFIGFLLEPGGKRTLYEIVEEDHYLLPEHKEITIERGG